MGWVIAILVAILIFMILAFRAFTHWAFTVLKYLEEIATKKN